MSTLSSINKLYIGVIVLLLAILVFRFITYSKDIKEYQKGQKITFTATLSEDPVVSAGTETFHLPGPGGVISVVTDAKIGLRYGDVVAVSGIVGSRVTKSGRTQFVLYYPSIREKTDTSMTAGVVSYVQDKAAEVYTSVLPQTSSSLLLGIVFGRKQHFDYAFYKNLQQAGVLHVIAASGMNTSMVGAGLLFLFGLFLPRKVGLLFTIGGLLFYALLAGFAPSIMRATIMAVFAFSGGLIGRQYTAYLGLILAGYLMLVWKPTLLSDVGFQLSFMATLGIIVFQPLLAPLRRGGLAFVGNDLSTTLAAQIGTLPIMLATFGQYSLLSIPANALVLWMVPPLMILGSLAVIAGMVFLPLGSLLAFLCLPFLSFFIAVINRVGGMSYSLPVSSFPAFCIAGYYLLLLSVVVLVWRRNAWRKEAHN